MPSKTSKSKQKPSIQAAGRTFHFEAIGTVWNIRLYQKLSDLEVKQLFEKIKKRIELFDRTYSRFRADSFVKKVASKADQYVLPDDAEPLFDLYDKLSRLTHGKVNPLVGHLLEDAGYDARYSLKPTTLRPVPVWSDTVQYDFPTLILKEAALIDVGAAGKGYLVDIVGDLIEGSGIQDFSINAGGDILFHTALKQCECIGLEHPDNFDQAIGIATICNQSICGSAGNRRAWEGFNHIIDPILKASPSNIKAVWVVAESALLADGLTTALYFTKPDTLQKEFRFEYAIINEDNSLEYSKDFPADFFTQEQKEAKV